MKDLGPPMPREMRCKPPNAVITYKNLRGHIYLFENYKGLDDKDLNFGKIRPHHSNKNCSGLPYDVYFIKEELNNFKISDCHYNNPFIDPGPEVFFDFAFLELQVEFPSGYRSGVATNIRLVEDDKKEKKERKERNF